MNTAGRRRRQAINGYTHLPKKHRPVYTMAKGGKSVKGTKQ